MIKGFLVKIIEDGEEKQLKLLTAELTLGNSYKSAIHVKELNNQVIIARHKEHSLSVKTDDNLDITIYKDNRSFRVSELKDIIDGKDYLELNKDVICELKIYGKKIIFKAQEYKEEKKGVAKQFQKSYVSKENIRFISLVLVISALLYSFMIFAVISAKPIKQSALVDQKVQEMEIDYRIIEKQEIKKESTKETKAGESLKAKTIKEEVRQAKSAEGTFFEGPAIHKEGVLGVKEGAKTVIIQKEKSLFSKIDETLDTVPIKGSDETSDRAKKIEQVISQNYETVKAESIYKGPEKKEVKAELSAGKQIQAVVQKESDIRVLKGKRPENEILSVISRYRKGFEFLFIDARKRDPGLEGKVVVFFVITEEGEVSKAEIAESTIKNQEFLDKILNLVKSIRFPRSDTGDTGVKIPLLFFPQS